MHNVVNLTECIVSCPGATSYISEGNILTPSSCLTTMSQKIIDNDMHTKEKLTP